VARLVFESEQWATKWHFISFGIPGTDKHIVYHFVPLDDYRTSHAWRLEASELRQHVDKCLGDVSSTVTEYILSAGVSSEVKKELGDRLKSFKRATGSQTARMGIVTQIRLMYVSPAWIQKGQGSTAVKFCFGLIHLHFQDRHHILE
jgi:hypothetical protein